MKSFDEIISEREKNNKIINKGNKNITLSKEDIVYDNYLVNSIKDIKSHASLENIINRFEKIDREYGLLSLEERFLDKKISKDEIDNKVIQYLSEKNKKFSLEVSVPYLDYFNKGEYEFMQNSKTGKHNAKNILQVFLNRIGNYIITSINLIIKIINIGIHFVLTLVQFITTQFFKLLASKTIPQQEFDIKIARLKQDSFKKNIKTRYQLNVGDIVIEGLRNFSKFGNMVESKYKWLLDQYEDMIKKSGYQEPNRSIDFDDFGKMQFSAKTLLTPYMNELYQGIAGSLQKDFLEKTISQYNDSFTAKLYKNIKAGLYNSEILTIKENLETIELNNIQDMARQTVKVIFGKKEKAESIDILEFFRLNSGIITDTKKKELDNFVNTCKQSIKNYREFERMLKSRALKLDLGKNTQEVSEEGNVAEKFAAVFLMMFYTSLVNPFTRFTCTFINYTRRGFVLEFYKLKSFMLSLWNKATFYKDGEEPDFESANMDEGDIETPQEVLRIAEIPAES